MLGGSYPQIPAITEAKNRGLHTILADYYPDVPGKNIADEFYNVSTTDLEQILKLARKKDIDFILGYMSDPAALTVAYVSENLGIPGNSFSSVELMTQKEKFRKFQAENGFHTPKFRSFTGNGVSKADFRDFDLPVIVKPVDSSDSKGVFVADNPEDVKQAAIDALHYSRSDRIIIEEFIDSDIANLHGDAFIIDGEMKFCLLGDNLFFSDSHPFKPSSELYPSQQSDRLIRSVEKEVANFIKLSGFRNGPVNIEVRVNSKNKIYIMEIGPRSGGGDTPQAIYHAVGFDMLKATFDWMLNQPVQLDLYTPKTTVSFIIHSNSPGKFDSIEFDSELSEYIAEVIIYSEPGDQIKSFDEPGSNIGVVILKFNDFDEFEAVDDDFYQRMINSVRIKREGSE